jgi:hypothetical protein
MKRFVFLIILFYISSDAKILAFEDINPKLNIIRIASLSKLYSVKRLIKTVGAKYDIYIKKIDNKYKSYIVNIKEEDKQEVLKYAKTISLDSYFIYNAYDYFLKDRQTKAKKKIKFYNTNKQFDLSKTGVFKSVKKN